MGAGCSGLATFQLIDTISRAPDFLRSVKVGGMYTTPLDASDREFLKQVLTSGCDESQRTSDMRLPLLKEQWYSAYLAQV